MTTCPPRSLSESLAGRALVLSVAAEGRALTVGAGEPSRTEGAANLMAIFISKVALRLGESGHAVTRIGNHPDFHDAMPTGLHDGVMPPASTIAPDECHGIVPMMSEIGFVARARRRQRWVLTCGTGGPSASGAGPPHRRA